MPEFVPAWVVHPAGAKGGEICARRRPVVRFFARVAGECRLESRHGKLKA
jgi:hypothetical protein